MDSAAGVIPSLRLEPSVEPQSPCLARHSGLHVPQRPHFRPYRPPRVWAKPASQRPREEQIQQSITVGRMSFHKHYLMEQVEGGQEKMMVRWALAPAARCGSCLERGNPLPVHQQLGLPPRGLMPYLSLLPVPILFWKGKAELYGDKV